MSFINFFFVICISMYLFDVHENNDIIHNVTDMIYIM